MNEEITVDIQVAINMMHVAKQMEEEAEELRKKAGETLLPFMEGNKLTKLPGDHGTVSYISPTVQKKFNKDRAKNNLLLKGVGAVVIADCFDRAVDESPRAGYLKFEVSKEA